MGKTKDKKTSKNQGLAILAVSCMIVLTIYLIYRSFGPQFLKLYQMLKRGNQQEIGDFLNRQGQWKGMLSIYFISILQVVSIFIPGMAIQISGGLIYGWWRAFLMCYTGFVSGNVLVFLFARKIGNKVLDLMGVPQKNWISEKINNHDPGFVIAMACLVPGVPNGIIPYLAARTAISTGTFTLAIVGSCWLQIICNCVAGHFLIRGEYLFMILSFAFQILIIVLATWKKDALMERFHSSKKQEPLKIEENCNVD